jgi:hypothetical protein
VPDFPSVQELREACARFGSDSGFDRSYLVFSAATAGRPNLSIPAHTEALHRWLNAWGCRIAYSSDRSDDLFARSLSGWWRTWSRQLPGREARLAQLTDDQIERAAGAYGGLCLRPVARARGAGGSRTLAPTATAKTLWALRPHAITPWDARIAQRLHGRRDETAFADHLRLARGWARVLIAEAGGEKPLLDAIGRSGSTVARVLDEYWYVTLSKGWSAAAEDARDSGTY